MILLPKADLVWGFVFANVRKGNNTLRIYLASIIFSLLVLVPHTCIAQDAVFTQASCTVVYSLKRTANRYFNEEIAQLGMQIDRQNIHFIDLNNWGKASPHIEVSGRMRNQLRQQYDLKKSINQAIVVNSSGEVIQRYTGSVTLVSALLDCS